MSNFNVEFLNKFDSFNQTFGAYKADITDALGEGDGVTTGFGAMDGRLVYAASFDSDYISGSIGEINVNKIVRTIEMAVNHAAPFVISLTSKGGRLTEGYKMIGAYSKLMTALSKASGEIPTICLIASDAIGLNAEIAALCDFAIAKKDVVVSASLMGNNVIADKFTADKVATMHQLLSVVCDNDEAILESLSDLLAYLPESAESGAPDFDGSDDDSAKACAYCDSISNNDFDVYSVIKDIVDNGEYFELMANFAKELVACFARIDGKVVGILANNPKVYDGCISTFSGKKAIQLLAFCDNYDIPVITLTSSKGLSNCDICESAGLTNVVAKMVSTFANADIPLLNIVIGDTYGASLAVFNSNQSADYTLAWNTANISLTNPAVCAACENDVPSVDKINEYLSAVNSPEAAARAGLIDEIITPAETRAKIITYLDTL